LSAIKGSSNVLKLVKPVKVWCGVVEPFGESMCGSIHGILIIIFGEENCLSIRKVKEPRDLVSRLFHALAVL
jgi:hypothetical protein